MSEQKDVARRSRELLPHAIKFVLTFLSDGEEHTTGEMREFLRSASRRFAQTSTDTRGVRDSVEDGYEDLTDLLPTVLLGLERATMVEHRGPEGEPAPGAADPMRPLEEFMRKLFEDDPVDGIVWKLTPDALDQYLERQETKDV